MRRALALLAIGFAAGCPRDAGDPIADPEAAPTVIAPIDAAPAPAGDGGITEIRSHDPASGMHLDDDDTGPAAGGGFARPRNRRTLEILLRSTPTGATALVDNQPVGTTPVLWEGEFTGREREFSFVKRGYVLGRYKFVPIQNGIVHAKLTSVIGDEAQLRAAGIRPESLPVPPAPPRRRPATASDVRPATPVDAAPALDAGATTVTPPPPTTPPSPDTGSGPPP